VVGVVSTTVLACRATLKLDESLEESQKLREQAQEAVKLGSENYTEKEFDREMRLIRVKTASTIVKLYGPPIVLGIASVAMLTGSHIILTKRNGAVMAAFAGLDRAFDAYRKRVIDELGEEKDKEFRHGYQVKEVVEEGENGPEKVFVKRHVGAPEGYARIFDATNSKMWSPEPMVNQNLLRCQQEWANQKLRTTGHLFLNEVYDMLGMERTPAGAVVGWIYESDEGDSYVDFGVFRNDVFMGQLFVNGEEKSVWLDFNCQGVIYDKIGFGKHETKRGR
jgi:hypothetical protein